MNIDFNNRLPNKVSNDYHNVYEEIKELDILVARKYRELSTIGLMDFLKTTTQYYDNYKISLKLKYDIDGNFYYFRIECYSPVPINDKKLESEIRQLLTMPDYHLANFYKENKDSHNNIEFINNESGRDSLLKYMIGENWQQWKKEGEIMDSYDKLSNRIPNKETTTKPKLKI